jgi:hypothetical protein
MITEIVSITIAVISLIVAYLQFKHNKKIDHNKQLADNLNKLWSDEEIRSVIQMLEYNDTWYNEGFHGSPLEIKVDKTLQFLSHICFLRKNGILNDTEFDAFEYELKHLFQNKSVINYLSFLFHFSQRALANGQSSPFPFKDLLEYGIDNNLVDKSLFI